MSNKEEVRRTYSPLALAYLGDGVYELLVRDYVLAQGNCQNNKLHEKAKKFVSCAAQSHYLALLEPFLEEDEREIVRRGRNARIHTKPRNAELGAYHAATGLEALFGYLYLSEDHPRLQALFDKMTSFCKS